MLGGNVKGNADEDAVKWMRTRIWEGSLKEKAKESLRVRKSLCPLAKYPPGGNLLAT